MSKQIEWNREIYLAPDILGKYNDFGPIVIDERNGNIELDPNDIETKILIYEREVKEWFLEPASELLNQDSFKNSFIVLMVCMAYFEGVEQYKTGVDSSRRSKECFIDSIERLYPNKFRRSDIGKLYAKSRCGLFHNGMVKGGVVFNNSFGDAIEFANNGENININPTLLLERIMKDFEEYVSELRQGITESASEHSRVAIENFDRMFSVL
jgi:hypothetical protein